MDRQSTTRQELKYMLLDENVEPKALPLSLLKEITNGFSDEQEIGRGGFAVVYKGVLDNGASIAVKRLSHAYMHEKEFHREIECLIKAKHQNVVRFIGYCAEARPQTYDGRLVMADVIQRLLCFEYLPRGSLDKYITSPSFGLDWRTRYRIINGICDGLDYLHENHIVHLDLKPANILFDGNMLPKIIDFGLSRCFDEKQSRDITKSTAGTWGYLAPEFGSSAITYQFDLYSLGVIIMEILTGRKGYEDVENVLESWSNMLEKSHRDIQLEQVRVCIEIGIECIESNPAKRPASMQHIIYRLHKSGNTEGVDETASGSSALQAETDYDDPLQGVVLKAPGETSPEACMRKVGPWGGYKGNFKYINVASLRLNSITIRSGEVIYSFAFSYSDDHGKQHHAGPWGACEGFSYGSFDTIQLGPSEFLTEVSGTICFSTQYSANVVSSVMFTTNARQYGPFGGGEGIPFHSPVISNGSIVGFFAHAERVVYGIGLYVHRMREPVEEQVLIDLISTKDSVTKIGPWGGDSGTPNDVDVLPRRLISVVLHSGKVINSLEFAYSDGGGQQRTAGPWGRTGETLNESFHKILLGRSEFLIEVSGTVGRSSKYSDVVTSLLFVTNTGSYGPYGKGGGTRFRSPLQSNGSIVGFFANAGDMIGAIGVYVSSERGTIKEEEEGGSWISDDMASRGRVDKESVSDVLECIILDGRAEPTNLPLPLLQQITENFAHKRIIGRGGFGVVYKGDLRNGSVAVKKLLNCHTIEEEAFNREATSLISVKHQNIVRFLGYCANTENKAVIHSESGKTPKLVFAEIRERLLCFEYISNGSLDKYLTDELRGLEWHTRYKIIRGICDGLVYLHMEKGIVHMDIKPGNILLDDRMIPKITDFGISKLLDGASHVVTRNTTMTFGYCAPELINHGIVSINSDTYSLGIIIKELVTGRKDNPDIKHVLRRWRYRWNKSAEYPPFGSEQVTKCIEIALSCVSEYPKRRPCVWDIVSMLDELESTNEHEIAPVAGPISPYPWEMLEFDTLELHFPFEINMQMMCMLQLTNVRDHCVAFDIEPTGILKYRVEPTKGVMSPRSKCIVTVALQAQKRMPHAAMCRDEFVIVRCAAVNEGLADEDITEGMFDCRSGKEVDEVTVPLKVVV